MVMLAMMGISGIGLGVSAGAVAAPTWLYYSPLSPRRTPPRSPRAMETGSPVTCPVEFVVDWLGATLTKLLLAEPGPLTRPMLVGANISNKSLVAFEPPFWPPPRRAVMVLVSSFLLRSLISIAVLRS